jgi:hypothetical protein
MFLGSRARPVRRADTRTSTCEAVVQSVGFLTSHNPIGLHGLLQGIFFYCSSNAGKGTDFVAIVNFDVIIYCEDFIIRLLQGRPYPCAVPC